MADLTVRELFFLFYDVTVRLGSDSPRFVEYFERMYKCFEVPVLPPGKQTGIEISVHNKSGDKNQAPELYIDGQRQRLSDSLSWEAQIYDLILNAILPRVRSHLLIHAGVVAKGDRALVLSGESMHGKTTLVLSLARRGFQLLSDELAPLKRGTHRVSPFPRSLRVRPGTLERAGYQPELAGTQLWFDKLLVDFEQIQPGGLSESIEIGWVVILKNPVIAQPEDSVPLPERELGIFFDRMDDELLQACEQIEGVMRVWRSNELGYPVLRLQANDRMTVLAKIEAICQERGISIINVIKRPLRQPSFDQPARLEPILKTQAVMELVRQFQPGHRSELLQSEYQGSSSRLFLDLADCIEKAACYQLSVGSLSETIDLLCGL